MYTCLRELKGHRLNSIKGEGHTFIFLSGTVARFKVSHEAKSGLNLRQFSFSLAFVFSSGRLRVLNVKMKNETHSKCDHRAFHHDILYISDDRALFCKQLQLFQCENWNVRAEQWCGNVQGPLLTHPPLPVLSSSPALLPTYTPSSKFPLNTLASRFTLLTYRSVSHKIPHCSR